MLKNESSATRPASCWKSLISERREFELAGTADGYAAGGAFLKVVVAGFFPLARAFSNGQTNKGDNDECKKKIFSHH